MRISNAQVLALCFALLKGTAALPRPQDEVTYDLPKEELKALADIVEDDPVEVIPDYVPMDEEPVPMEVDEMATGTVVEINEKRGVEKRGVEKRGVEKRGIRKQVSPAFKQMFSVALPIPPIKKPLHNIKNPVSGKDMEYYEVRIKPFQQKVYSNLAKSASLVGYDGIAPGPTFYIKRGTEAVVRFINEATQANSVHLHGSPSRAPWDGWAEDITNPGQYKDYYYPNAQSARTLWYHDHAMHLTAENAYNGQAGAYIIYDPDEDNLNLPSGYGKYDIPLILSSKQYKSDGSLVSTIGETDSLWGDVLHVNGQPWPFLNVEPRKYRFRLLDAAISRSFALYFAQTTSTKTKIPFQVIASDAGLLSNAVETSTLFISMGERYEVVFDFSKFAGKTIELRNLQEVGEAGTDDDYDNTDKVMRFVVAKTGSADTSSVPSSLRQVPWPSSSHDTIDHHFRFHRSNGEWQINGVTFSDAENRMLGNVPENTVEIWELENSSGGWSHPIHIHLVDFKVLSRTGNRGVQSYEEAGLKDVVWLGRGETVRVEAHYAPWPGVYMFHCHNLIHEDNDMMASFNVSVLPDYGYNATELIDPMEKKWRSKDFKAADLSGRTGPFKETEITKYMRYMAEFGSYDHRDE